MNRSEGWGGVRRRLGLPSAVLVLTASLLAVGAPPGGAVDGEADAEARFSACVGPALERAGFEDITRSFAEDAVNCLAHYRITKGRTADSFDPDAPVLRWQMALFMARAAGPAGIILPPASNQGFIDVEGVFEEGRRAIDQMAELRIMAGEGGGRFGPDEAVNRAEMALILEAFLKEAEVGAGGEDISDVQPDDDVFDDLDRVTRNEYQAIRKMFEAGVAVGTSRNRFSPDGLVTRAQMAVFITRALAHTQARPEGLTFQAEDAAVTLGEPVEMVVSIRDRRFVPVTDALVDLFYASDAGDAFERDGTCDIDEVRAVQGSVPCEIVYGDDITDESGDLEVVFAPEETATVWAWSGRVGDEYDDDRDSGRGSSLRIGVTKGADRLRVTDDMADNSRYVRFGQRVTFTFQLVDEDGASVREKDQQITIAVEESVFREGVGSASQRSSSTRTYRTDQTGRVTLSFRQVDPRPSSRDAGDRAELDLDVFLPAGSGLTLDDMTALGMAGGGAGDRPAAVWSDEAGTASSYSLILSQSVSYHEASDSGRGAVNSVAAVLVDQYGEALSRRSVSFYSDDPDGIGAAADGSARLRRTTNRSGRAVLTYSRDSDENGAERIWAVFTDPGGAGAADDILVRAAPITHYWAEEATGALSGPLLEKDTAANRLVVSSGGRIHLIEYDGNDQLNNLDGPATLAAFEAHLGHTGEERPIPKEVVAWVRVDAYASRSSGVSSITLLGGSAADVPARAAQVLLSDDLDPGQTHLKLDAARTVAFTLQVADSAGNPVAERGWQVTVTYTETPVGGSAGAQRTRTVTTDDEGRAEFSFTQAGTAAAGETAKVVFTVSAAARSGASLPVVGAVSKGAAAPDDDPVTADRGKYRVQGADDGAGAAAGLVISRPQNSSPYTAASSGGAQNTVTARIVDKYGVTAASVSDTVSFLSDDENGLWAEGSTFSSAEAGGKRVLGGTAKTANQQAASGGSASVTYSRASSEGAVETIWASVTVGADNFTSNRLYHYWTERARAPVTGRILHEDPGSDRLVIFAQERVMLVEYDGGDLLNGSRSLSAFEDGFSDAAHLRVAAYNPGGVSRLELLSEWPALDHPDGPAAGAAARFGQSFAADNGVLVVGAGNEAVGGAERAGRVYVYDGMGDSSPAVLSAPSPEANGNFGYDVDISGDTIAVGAPRNPHLNEASAADNGRVFVYVRPAGGWRTGQSPAAVLTNSGLGASGRFTLAASVNGVNYPACTDSARFNHRFGYGVAVSRDESTVAVTSRDPRAPVPNCSSASSRGDGLAYVFEKNDNGTPGWENDNGRGRAVLWPSTTIARTDGNSEEFGRERSVSVSNDGGVIVVGMGLRPIQADPSDPATLRSRAGSAYVFVRRGPEWNTGDSPVARPVIQTAVLAAPQPREQQWMGKYVAVSGDGGAVAASGHFAAGQGKPGEMFVFTRPAGGWADSSSPAVLSAERGRAADVFGQYVAINNAGTEAAAGRHYRQEGDFRGSVVVFGRPSGGWADDGSVDEEYLGAAVNGHLGWQTAFDKTTDALYSAHRSEPDYPGAASGGRLLTVFRISR